MKIGFDVSQTAQNKAGCGFVADQLIRNLVKLDRENQYILYPTFYKYRHPDCRNITHPEAANCINHFKNLTFEEMGQLWERPKKNRQEQLGNPDIIHFYTFSCHKDHRAKIVYTLYDVSPLACPHFFRDENRVNCLNGLFMASIYADHCIAISEHTKNEFLHYFPHYPEERITVIPLGTRPELKHIKNPKKIEKKLQKLQIKEGEFWLSVGTIEPRKNFTLLIDVFYQLNDSRSLVIAGGKGWLDADILNRPRELGIEDRVKFLDYVSDEELSALYASCFAFVYPSHYEGFGLPVLEAMSLGAPVIMSRSSSLTEVGGEAVLYMDPNLKETLVEKMNHLILRPQEREEYKTKSYQRAKLFSWKNAAEIVLDVYHQTFQRESFFRPGHQKIYGR